MPKRGDRAAPPPRKGEWTLIFHDGQAAEGWEELCSAAPGPMLAVWTWLTRDPRANPDRVHRLQGGLSTRHVQGRTLEQWQHEVTGAGRIWYCPEDARRVVHITKATKGHPKEADRKYARGLRLHPT